MTDTFAPVLDDEGYIDTYNFGGQQVYTLPDGKQTITFKVMNEGDKANYQRTTSRDIKVDRKTNSAAFRPDPATDRHALILTAVVDWTLVTRKTGGGWERMAFSKAMLGNWLATTNPIYAEELEDAIRKANPWLQAEEDTVESLQKELIDVQERLDAKRAEEAGKAS